MEVGRWWKSSW